MQHKTRRMHSHAVCRFQRFITTDRGPHTPTRLVFEVTVVRHTQQLPGYAWRYILCHKMSQKQCSPDYIVKLQDVITSSIATDSAAGSACRGSC